MGVLLSETQPEISHLTLLLYQRILAKSVTCYRFKNIFKGRHVLFFGTFLGKRQCFETVNPNFTGEEGRD